MITSQQYLNHAKKKLNNAGFYTYDMYDWSVTTDPGNAETISVSAYFNSNSDMNKAMLRFNDLFNVMKTNNIQLWEEYENNSMRFLKIPERYNIVITFNKYTVDTSDSEKVALFIIILLSIILLLLGVFYGFNS